MGLFDSFKTVDPVSAQQGKLVVIDGPHSAERATQTELLAKTLSESGYDGAVFDFPQHNTISAPVLEKYASGEYGPLNPEAISVLYSIDRLDASLTIRNYLKAGKVVLANQYVSSNAVNQGAQFEEYQQRVKYYKWLDHLEYVTFGIPRPDLTVILHIPFEVSWELAQEQTKSARDINSDYLKRREEVCMEIADLFPNTRLVECYEEGRLLTPTEIHTKVWELVRRIALKGIPPHQQL